MIQLGEHFRSNELSRHSEWLRQQHWFVKARQEHDRKEDVADRLEDDFLSYATDAVMATQVQIEQFGARLNLYETKLDTYEANLNSYDAAIIRALTENRKLLDKMDTRLGEVGIQLQDMRDHASVIEDGRHVFKFEDGTRVVDEFGKNVTRDEVDFDLVSGPHAERYLSALTEQGELQEAHAAALEDRNKLHGAQDKLDAARENLSQAREKLQGARDGIEKEGLTVGEIEELEADLLDAMPPSTLPTLPISAVKHLSQIENSATIPSVKDAFAANATPATDMPQIKSPIPHFEPAG